MPDKNDFWVTPAKSGGWNVKREGNERASSNHSTQQEAWGEAISRAKTTSGEAYLQGRNGQIRERNTYGNDPKKTRG